MCWRPHLAAAMLCVNVSGHRETCVQQLLSVIHRSLEQVFEVLIFGHLLVPGLPPLSHRLTKSAAHYLITGYHPDDDVMKFN